MYKPNSYLVVAGVSLLCVTSGCLSHSLAAAEAKRPAAESVTIELINKQGSNVELRIQNHNEREAICVPTSYLEEGWQDGFSVRDTTSEVDLTPSLSEYVVAEAAPVHFVRIESLDAYSIVARLQSRFSGWKNGHIYEVSWRGSMMYCSQVDGVEKWIELVRLGDHVATTIVASAVLEN